jgi:peroxiredoxin
MKEIGSTVGELAPDFTLSDLDGKPRRLSDFRGQKALLYIWGSW